MEFWGVEVKPGQSYTFTSEDDRVLHLSQSCVGEVKKGKEESVIVYAKVDNQKLVIGTLSADKFPQISHDLVFDKDFELSHSSKNGSIYFTGYLSIVEDGSDDEGFPMSDSDEELGVEDLPVDVKENGKAAKPDAASAAKKVKVVDPKADEVDSDESESEDSDSDEDEEMGEDDSDEADSSDEEEQTPTPKGKKRAAEVANKKPTPGDKKAKLETPQKSGADGKKADGKKVGAVQPGTPYPKGGKTPASGGNKNKSPKSGSVSCNSCSKAFGTDSALQAHSKAKHNK